MSPDQDQPDRALRDDFAALRRHEEAAVPPLAELIAQAGERRGAGRRGPRPLSLLFVSAAVAACVLAASLVLRQGGETRQAVIDVAHWQSPTASLLETPGRELLDSTPAIPDLPAASILAPAPGTAAPRPRRRDPA